MSVVKMHTVAFAGMNAIPVEVEVKVETGLPRFVIVGLPDTIVSESKIRISKALAAALPAKSITVNLSPADIKKEGSHYDLPIALCLLVALKILPYEVVENYIAVGELSLDGKIIPSKGVLLASMCANELEKGIICAKDSSRQALLAGGNLEILGANNIVELINFFKKEGTVYKPELDIALDNTIEDEYNHLDFAQVKGQESAKLALQIAAAGGHHVLLVGPPGCGKTMLSSRFPTILPDLEPQVSLEATILHNLVGKLNHNKPMRKPAWRDPHHSASMAALIGGGTHATPGEISLAHGGVLFLDEFAEFSNVALQSLREAMETGQVTISRAQARYTYPARFQLIAAMNPCKCGMFGEKKCVNGVSCSQKYWQKISGPLLDRFDLCVQLRSLKPWELCALPTETITSSQIKSKVIEARKIQYDRQGMLNAHLSQNLFEEFTKLDDKNMMLLKNIAKKYELSGRGLTRLLKVARTIADMNCHENISENDLLEAASFKLLYG